jgi:hypothetical protein
LKTELSNVQQAKQNISNASIGHFLSLADEIEKPPSRFRIPRSCLIAQARKILKVSEKMQRLQGASAMLGGWIN